MKRLTAIVLALAPLAARAARMTDDETATKLRACCSLASRWAARPRGCVEIPALRR
jgi:hypothetical protein